MSNKIQYYVNEEKRTVVAKIPYFQDELDSLCEKYVTYESRLLKGDSKAGEELRNYIRSLTNKKYPNEYYAIARAHEKDTWNVEIGKKIARARLLKKINSVKRDVLYSVLKYIQDNTIYNLERAVRFYGNKADKQEKNLEDILGAIEG